MSVLSFHKIIVVESNKSFPMVSTFVKRSPFEPSITNLCATNLKPPASKRVCRDYILLISLHYPNRDSLASYNAATTSQFWCAGTSGTRWVLLLTATLRAPAQENGLQLTQISELTGQMMPGAPQAPTQAQILQQQQAEHQAQMRRQEEAKNRSRKPVNKHLPEGLDQIVIGDGVQQYKSMRDVERKLDAVMMRKRLDIQDSLQRGPKQYGAMRIWISNTVENQPWQAGGMDPHSFDFNSNIEATFRVKIEGRLLDPETGEPQEEGEDGQKEQGKESTEQDAAGDSEPAAKRTRLTISPTSRKKFSHFFKSISIDFDRPQAFQPDGYTQIKWTRPDYPATAQAQAPAEADFHCLEFERKADENINVVINLIRDEHPAEKYKLSQPLAELLDMEEADRPTVLMGIWEYVKLANLQMDEEQRRVSCDAKLREVCCIRLERT